MKRVTAMSELPPGRPPGSHPGDPLRDEERLRGLFAAQLPAIAPPAVTTDRLLREVQAEVRRVYPPKTTAGQVAPGWLERFRGWVRTLRPVHSLALAGATALAILLLLAGVSRLMPRPLSAVAEVSLGDVMILRASNGSFRVFHEGEILRLQQGDQVITDSGKVTVTHFPGQVAVVAPGTHMELVQLDEAAGGTQVEMYVHDGTVRSAVDAPLDDNDRFVVSAPNVAVSAHGTEFTVETVSDEETVVTTVEGEVEVAADGQVVEVAAGEALAIAEGEPLVVGPAEPEDVRRRPFLLVALAVGRLLKLHAQPEAASRVIGEVTNDRTFTVEEQDATGEWYRVCCVAGEEGWLRVPRLEPGR